MMSEAYAVNARMAAALSTLSCWVCSVTLVTVAVTHHPVNHIALDIRVCYVLGGLSIAAGLLGRAGGGLKASWVWTAFLSGAALVLAVFVLDQWNIVVGYEVWLERGQPSFGVRS